MAKRLVIVTRYWYPDAGGAELATYLFTERFFTRMFSEVDVVSGTPPTRAQIPRGVRYRYCGVVQGNKPSILVKVFTRPGCLLRAIDGSSAVYIPSNALLFLPLLLRGGGYDGEIVVHLHDFQVLVYTASLIHGQEPGPSNDYYVERRDYGRGLRAIAASALHGLVALYRMGIGEADVVITASRRQAALLTRYLGEGIGKKVVVVYNPLPGVKWPGGSRGREGVIYTGGPKTTKGFYHLLRALQLVSKNIVKLSATLLGLDEASMTIARKLIGRKVEVYPRLPHEKVLALYAKHRVLAFPSIAEEPLPYSVVEAMLSGLVPVASRVGGIPELVEGTIAERFLVKPGDYRDLARKLEEALVLDERVLVEEAMAMRRKLEERLGDSAIEEKLRKIFG